MNLTLVCALTEAVSGVHVKAKIFHTGLFYDRSMQHSSAILDKYLIRCGRLGSVTFPAKQMVNCTNEVAFSPAKYGTVSSHVMRELEGLESNLIGRQI
eukprot:scaffold295358_cov19-Prasinocladus_malaysianus.AAC.1